MNMSTATANATVPPADYEISLQFGRPKRCSIPWRGEGTSTLHTDRPDLLYLREREVPPVARGGGRLLLLFRPRPPPPPPLCSAEVRESCRLWVEPASGAAASAGCAVLTFSLTYLFFVEPHAELPPRPSADAADLADASGLRAVMVSGVAHERADARAGATPAPVAAAVMPPLPASVPASSWLAPTFARLAAFVKEGSSRPSEALQHPACCSEAPPSWTAQTG